MATHELLRQAIPQFFPAHWLDDAPDVVWKEFPSRIRIGYVIRGNGQYSYIMQLDLEKIGTTIQELHDAALGNLQKLKMPALTVGRTPGGPKAFLAGVDDNFRAVRILLPSVQRALAKELGEEFFVTIPCRDWFVCWSKEQAGEWQSRNVAAARSDFLQDDHRLTPDIFLRSAAGFAIHLKQDV